MVAQVVHGDILLALDLRAPTRTLTSEHRDMRVVHTRTMHVACCMCGLTAWDTCDRAGMRCAQHPTSTSASHVGVLTHAVRNATIWWTLTDQSWHSKLD